MNDPILPVITTQHVLHGTVVAIGNAGILLRGASGAGKSDLALRLIDQGAILVADDRVMIHRAGGQLIAAPPSALAGLLEVRGVGILSLDYQPSSVLAIAIELNPDDAMERFPPPASLTLLGTPLPLYRLRPFEASTVAKIRLAIKANEDPWLKQTDIHAYNSSVG